jgi:hypothetical protein
VQLGGHGGCFTEDSNSPEIVSARETSDFKIKTTTAPNKTENQIMLLLVTDGKPLPHLLIKALVQSMQPLVVMVVDLQTQTAQKC